MLLPPPCNYPAANGGNQEDDVAAPPPCYYPAATGGNQGDDVATPPFTVNATVPTLPLPVPGRNEGNQGNNGQSDVETQRLRDELSGEFSLQSLIAISESLFGTSG
jgi:hypothetical protein